MHIKLDNLDDLGFVMAYCDDPEAAVEDQTIDGCRWEAPADMTVAYAMLVDRPGLVADLEKEGYELNLDEYSPPDEED